MATDRTFDEIALSRRRLIGTAAGAAGAALVGGSLPSLGGRAVVAQDGAKEFHTAWPYEIPPQGHFNLMQGVARAIFQPPNIYADLIIQPMAMYYWATRDWLPLLATEWGFQDGEIFQVKLRQGAKWSDGAEITAKDVLASFSCARLMKVTLWNYIDQVSAVDDYTVNFHMSVPSTVVERYVLRFNVMSSVHYGDWAKQADDLFASGKTLDDPEGKQLLDQFVKFRPDNVIASGPFMFDVNSFTNSQNTLLKNEQAWNAADVKFDRIINYNGETPDITPVVLAKDVDYATHGFPPATEQQFISMAGEGLRVLRPPVYNGIAIFINYNTLGNVFGDKRVRQALAHAIKRDQNGAIALGQSGVGIKYMSGMSDLQVADWLSQADIDALNQYEFNLEKATALLTEVGWTKDGDTWKLPDGSDAAWELMFPAEFADSSAAGLDVVEQLGNFGIKLEPRAITYTQHPIDLDQGKFQLAMEPWGSSQNPHPHFAFDRDLVYHNTQAIRNGGQGMGFPMKQTTDAFGDVDFEQLITESALGLDEEAQKANVAKIAKAFNELLPIIPLYERFGNNAAWEGVRVKAWPADDDPILKNAPYADGIPTMLLYTGRLEPV
ncbi:MAG: peptide/nickel transport system substrate-binding protein [Thermomicrobiales bacterium]|nr:peptide/nickel transport system substrate-binding protein [Thermomicrobiales bacterium]